MLVTGHSWRRSDCSSSSHDCTLSPRYTKLHSSRGDFLPLALLVVVATRWGGGWHALRRARSFPGAWRSGRWPAAYEAPRSRLRSRPCRRRGIAGFGQGWPSPRVPSSPEWHRCDRRAWRRHVPPPNSWAARSAWQCSWICSGSAGGVDRPRAGPGRSRVPGLIPPPLGLRGSGKPCADRSVAAALVIGRRLPGVRRRRSNSRRHRAAPSGSNAPGRTAVVS